MWLQISQSCKSEDTWKSRPKWKTIQQLLMWLLICKSCKSEDENQDQNEKSFSCTQCAPKFTNPADLKIHENHDQIKNPSAALNTALNGQSADLKICENHDEYENLFSCSLWYSKSANLKTWRYMKIRTKMKNHSAALNATSNLQVLLI